MKRQFNTRLSAIDWIAAKAEDEGQFEVMREELNYNFIYTGSFFVETSKDQMEVVMLRDDKNNQR